jgi:hypothetical protein
MPTQQQPEAFRIINHSVEDVPVGRLSEHPRNPRRGNTDKIGESIDENGFYGAVVAQLSTGLVLKGNHTFRKAVEKGARTIPTVWVDVDDDRALAILLADNGTHEGGGYDNAVLQAVLTDYYSTRGSLLGTGYSDEDWRRIMGEPFESFTELGGGAAAEDPDAPPPAETEGRAPEDAIIIPPRWDVLIECADEAEQVRMLEELTGRGMRVRALVS